MKMIELSNVEKLILKLLSGNEALTIGEVCRKLKIELGDEYDFEEVIEAIDMLENSALISRDGKWSFKDKLKITDRGKRILEMMRND
jgi:hypothetical protein